MELRPIEEDCGHCGGTGRVARYLGGEFRQLREGKGLSMREIARRMGVSAPYVCDLELGRRALGTPIATRYLAALGQQAAD